MVLGGEGLALVLRDVVGQVVEPGVVRHVVDVPFRARGNGGFGGGEGPDVV